MFEIGKTMFGNFRNHDISQLYTFDLGYISDMLALWACAPTGQYITYIPRSRYIALA